MCLTVQEFFVLYCVQYFIMKPVTHKVPCLSIMWEARFLMHERNLCMRNLTRRQKEILIFICFFTKDNGFPPTIREVGEHFSISSTNGVSDHLRALERKGYLSRNARRSRSLVPSSIGNEFFFSSISASATSAQSRTDGGRATVSGRSGSMRPSTTISTGPTTARQHLASASLLSVGIGHNNQFLELGQNKRGITQTTSSREASSGDWAAITHEPAKSPEGAVIHKLSQLAESEEDSSGNVIHIPLLGKVAAGQPILAVENVEDLVAVDLGLLGKGRTPNFALRVTGDSMIGDGIFTDDLVFIKQCSTAEPGEIVVALMGEEATIKRFFRDGEKIRLQPSNPSIKPIILQGDRAAELQILGKVVGLSRAY